MGPISKRAVERASDAVAESATTLTAVADSNGSPATASMMCPNEGSPSELGGVCCDVETLFPFSRTWGSTCAEGSHRWTRPTGLAGRVADCVKRTSTRIQQRTFNAMEAQHGGSSIDGVPFPIAPRSIATLRRVKANPIGRNQFNLAITHIAAKFFLLGRTGSLLAAAHGFPPSASGPTVTSNAPSESSE